MALIGMAFCITLQRNRNICTLYNKHRWYCKHIPYKLSYAIVLVYPFGLKATEILLQCIIKNSSVLHLPCYFVVSPSTGVRVTPSSPTVAVNATVVLNCSGQGGPNNTYKWSSGQTTPFLNFTIYNGTSDGGTYTCVVTNAAGNGSASATVYVTPTIITQPSDMLAVVNDNVTLVCEAEAFPPPQYIWEHREGNITGRSNVMGINSNKLGLNRVMFGDKGSYRCNVTSNGTTATSRYAIVTCK